MVQAIMILFSSSADSEFVWVERQVNMEANNCTIHLQHGRDRQPLLLESKIADFNNGVASRSDG